MGETQGRDSLKRLYDSVNNFSLFFQSRCKQGHDCIVRSAQMSDQKVVTNFGKIAAFITRLFSVKGECYKNLLSILFYTPVLVYLFPNSTVFRVKSVYILLNLCQNQLLIDNVLCSLFNILLDSWQFITKSVCILT